jgi:phenylalanyl-tRNA synthetase beta subunit
LRSATATDVRKLWVPNQSSDNCFPSPTLSPAPLEKQKINRATVEHRFAGMPLAEVKTSSLTSEEVEFQTSDRENNDNFSIERAHS